MQATSCEASKQTDAATPPQKVRSFEVKPRGSWKQLVGWNKDCKLQQEALKLGAEWRDQENRRDG